MQTFIVSEDPRETAKALDVKRLGKQRVEAIQIARTLLGITKGWKNHPAVKMWRGHEAYLVKVYLREIMDEWIDRGYQNVKCEEHYAELSKMVGDPVAPVWFSTEVFDSHKANLVRKDPDWYGDIFPDVDSTMSYVWPS